MGAILSVLAIINAGNFIRYISFPVMSGFTSAAASLIGLNQMKSMFGFTNGYYPQTGDGKVHENWEVMEWIAHNYYSVGGSPTSTPTSLPVVAPTMMPSMIGNTADNIVAPPITDSEKASAIKKYLGFKGIGKPVINPYAIAICFGLWIVLAVINTMKKRFKPTAERKKQWCFTIWTMLANIAPFFAIIIAAGIAHDIKEADNFDNYIYSYKFSDAKGGSWFIDDAITFNSDHNYYKASLKVVGFTPAGINILRQPTMSKPFGKLIVDVLPLALIAFMESYSVARKMAAIRNEVSGAAFWEPFLWFCAVFSRAASCLVLCFLLYLV